jgi:glycosyltransferase involved in cell wall biosynthesis
VTAGSGPWSPRFSIVTVVRNDIEGLKRTWRSLAAQTCTDFEWLVVDGASTDGTREWLEDLGDDRLLWTSEPDDGIYDAMNKGIRRIRGEIVQFLNADDALASSDVLQQVLTSREQLGWEWSYGLARVIDDDGALLEVKAFVPFKLRWLEIGHRAICHQSCFFTGTLVRQLGGYLLDVGLAADQEYCLRAARAFPPTVIGDVVVDYRAGGASWGQSPEWLPLQARRIRRRQGRRLGGSAISDGVLTGLLAVDARARSLVHARSGSRQ